MPRMSSFWGHSEAEPPTKDWTKVPGTYVADMQLRLHVGLPTTGVEAAPTVLDYLWKLFSCLALVGKKAPNPTDT